MSCESVHLSCNSCGNKLVSGTIDLNCILSGSRLVLDDIMSQLFCRRVKISCEAALFNFNTNSDISKNLFVWKLILAAWFGNWFECERFCFQINII